MKHFAILCSALVVFTAAVSADERVNYVAQIKPLLTTKCFACHGALKQESSLRLDAASLIRKGGDAGPVIVAGKAAQSLLMKRISAADADERMPPDGEGEPFTAKQIALLRRWIDQGAVAPHEPVPPSPREHWAYQPPRRPVFAKSGKALWVRNHLDALLAAKHEVAGLKPAPPAKKEVLYRRLYLDLVGLPPTRNELRAFLNDDSPLAYERAVDRLLDSPQYGERWGRHWMDVWRYSDWAGFGNEIRYSQRHIWRWRDWIVESLNADKGYDRMVVEMLAADELTPGDDDAIRATGFLARNWYKFDRNVWLDDVVEHTGKAFLGTTFKCARCHDHKYDPISQQEYYRLRAIFEPYDVRTDQAAGELDPTRSGLARVYDAKLDAKTYFFPRGDPRRADKEHPLRPATPAMIPAGFTVKPVSLPLKSYYPAMRTFVVNDMIAAAEASVQLAEAELKAAKTKLAQLERQQAASGGRTKSADARLASRTGSAVATPKPTDVTQSQKRAEHAVTGMTKKVAAAKAQLTAIKARVAAERAKYKVEQASHPSNTETLAKTAATAERLATLADADQKLFVANQELDRAKESASKVKDSKLKQAVATAEKKAAAARKAFDKAKNAATTQTTSYRSLGPTYPQTSSGRRLALARWIVNRRNPLTARVAVNHIWMRHFAAPLVEGVNDFGLRSPQPSLVDVLDYLAVELMDNRWSMKHVHRLIVTSNAYRMASSLGRAASPSSKIDPDNKLFWRTNPRRMEAETVRDSVLNVAGSLDLRLSGPDIDHKQGLTVARRSLYFRHARERQMEFLRMFDPANPRECYRRQESIRPQQAFALVNSSLALAQSRKLAGKLLEEEGSDDNNFVVAAFETVLSRRPSPDEVKACREFLAMQAKQLADPTKLELLSKAANAVPASTDLAQRARENLVLVLLNHNDFVTVR